MLSCVRASFWGKVEENVKKGKKREENSIWISTFGPGEGVSFPFGYFSQNDHVLRSL